MLIEMNVLSLCIPYHIYEENGRKLKEQGIMRSVTFFFARRILYRGSPKRNLSLDEFFQRMSIREDVPLATAREHAHVVMSVLADALSRGEFEDIRARYRSNSTMNSLKGSK